MRVADVARPSLIAIGASAGGVNALCALASALPEDFPAPVLVVLHVGAQPSHLPELLSRAGPLPASHAIDGEPIVPGHIHIAPPDRHMRVAGGHLHLSRGPKENCARPAIDPLLRSVAREYGPAAIGVILTGNLADGTLGLHEIALHGGITIAQNPSDAAHPQMPQNAARHVVLDYSPTLAQLPQLLITLVSGQEEEQIMEIAPFHPATAGVLEAREKPFESPVAFTCPECGGALKATRWGSITQFGCHIGHRYSAESLAVAQFEKLERVMRTAVRFLNERAEFCLQMADQSTVQVSEIAASWRAAGRQARDRAYKLRDLVEQDWITPESAEAIR